MAADPNLTFFEVVFASTASLILFILVFYIIKRPSSLMRPCSGVAGLSVLETIWILAHSKTLQEHMANIDDPSLDHLRKVCMFEICLGDIRGSRDPEAESEPLLE